MSRFEQGDDLAGQEMYGGMGEPGELCWLCVTHSTRSDPKLAVSSEEGGLNETPPAGGSEMGLTLGAQQDRLPAHFFSARGLFTNFSILNRNFARRTKFCFKGIETFAKLV